MLSRAKPIRLLVAYFVGGFGMTLIVGLVILFVLGDAGLRQSRPVPPTAAGAYLLIKGIGSL